MSINFRDKSLIPIWQKLQRGERLLLEDGLVLFKTNDLIALGRFASCNESQRMLKTTNGHSVARMTVKPMLLALVLLAITNIIYLPYFVKY
ncbi:MAG: hypothetical protein QME52_08225 [Bacteroidota bacterium]|nr:hypothetical protein [Bacteroidota bacterium]